jgi:hypothetical protein
MSPTVEQRVIFLLGELGAAVASVDAKVDGLAVASQTHERRDDERHAEVHAMFGEHSKRIGRHDDAAEATGKHEIATLRAKIETSRTRRWDVSKVVGGGIVTAIAAALAAHFGWR